jgi:hypothetical protein
MKTIRALLVVGLLLVLCAGLARGDGFKAIKFSWLAHTGTGYQKTRELESIMPVDFQLIDRHNEASGLYYGIPRDVEELEHMGSGLQKGVFQSTWMRQIPGTEEARKDPMFDSETGLFIFEKHASEILEMYSPAGVKVTIKMRRADTPHFPILISETQGLRQLVVYIALKDDINATIARIEYHLPERPTKEHLQIWDAFVSNLRER